MFHFTFSGSYLLKMKCKQLGIKDDKYDKDGIPPPNEDIHIYYIIVKNLHPTTGIADVWQCIPTK